MNKIICSVTKLWTDEHANDSNSVFFLRIWNVLKIQSWAYMIRKRAFQPKTFSDTFGTRTNIWCLQQSKLFLRNVLNKIITFNKLLPIFNRVCKSTTYVLYFISNWLNCKMKSELLFSIDIVLNYKHIKSETCKNKVFYWFVSKTDKNVIIIKYFEDEGSDARKNLLLLIHWRKEL